MCVCVLFPRFSDDFSVLLEVRGVQKEEVSLLTLLSPQGHIQLQLRLSPHALSFVSTHHRHYEYVSESPPPKLWVLLWVPKALLIVALDKSIC